MRRSWPAVSEVIQSRARFSARTRAQGMVRGGFERCAHVDMRVPGAQPCCTAGATALCPLSAPARHRQHTRHEIWMGKRSQAALEVRYCAPGWPFGPSYELADRLVAWSSGQLGHRRPKGRWRISSPLSVHCPTLSIWPCHTEHLWSGGGSARWLGVIRTMIEKGSTREERVCALCYALNYAR